MRLRRVLASDADPADYLIGANRAFGNWGDELTFRWAFRGGEILFWDDEGGKPVAASGISYRTLIDGREMVIISGSWTSPAARGTGAFARLIEATHMVARERQAITIGFGRMENISRQRLKAAGAEMHATFYCRSGPQSAPERPPVSLDPLDPSLYVFPSFFRYTTEEWRRQFIERPHAAIECVGRRGEWAAIVERAAEFDRVHAVSDEAYLPLLAARVHAEARRLFWFSMRQPSIPCEWTDGFCSTFPPSDVSAWTFQNGDRM
ncbi:MAG: hypothetical protein QOK37_1672 [Thermoanaerobaculia bacterium]|jgi:hypothetical protein|nr:hypothetical protein [Thermoanaerobaculia bacterium]